MEYEHLKKRKDKILELKRRNEIKNNPLRVQGFVRQN